MSSVAAHEILDAAGHDRRGRKYVIDQVAAVVILRWWMESKEQAAAWAALVEVREKKDGFDGPV